MSLRRLASLGATLACVWAPWAARAESATADDRIALSADGTTLSAPGVARERGGGGSLGWLHNFDADSLVGIAGEYQAIGPAHWAFGSLNGSVTAGPAEQRYTFYGEAHEGAGNDGKNSFHYSIEAVGIYGTYFHRLSAQLEDKQIDVQTTRGNLPKVGISYLWNPHFQTQASYSHSVSGNVGTALTTARIDGYTSAVNLFAGVAFGQASAALVIVSGGSAANRVTDIPSRQLHEGYIGMSKPLSGLRSEISVIADYQNLSGTKHATITLNYIFHVGHTSTAR